MLQFPIVFCIIIFQSLIYLKIPPFSISESTADAADNFRFSSSNSLGLSSNTSWLPLAGGAGANSIPLGGANNSGPGLNADELLAQINAQSSGAAAQTMAAQSSTPPLTMQQPPEPRYSYTSVNVANIGNIAPHIVINSQVREAFYFINLICITHFIILLKELKLKWTILV